LRALACTSFISQNGQASIDMVQRPISTQVVGGPIDVPGLTSADAQALLRAAERGGGCGPGSASAPLTGMHVAVVTESQCTPSARVFAGAARALGARVVHIRPAELHLGEPAGAHETARMLGRLYAAIGCDGLDRESVTLLERACGTPVLHDLAGTLHASRLLADLLTLRQTPRMRTGTATLPPRLGVRGRPRSRLLGAWQRMAPGAGVQVVDLSAADGAHSDGCDFICLAQTPPGLFAIGAGTAPGETVEQSLAGPQATNHQLIVQALLCRALGTQW
jgi:hypothetical protein